jgi:L-Lysine epsilon oxidase N-terminal/L-lysine epsilon oxidase C-terminal domain
MPLAYRIHPAIGVARVGDSPEDFFIGPEAPGIPPTLTKPDAPALPAGQKGKYKDSKSSVKRQGARFRIYEYTSNSAGAVTSVREITAADARIEWDVHLVNRKAAAERPPESEEVHKPARRNKDAASPEGLVIDAGLQSISGVSQGMNRLQGRFMDKVDVPIGDLLTDAAGRLIVLGGFGKSQSVPPGVPLKSFVNNDGWCDDTSDGPVRAKVTLNGSAQTVEADPAWVLVAPPDFAPSIENAVTLYDVVYDQTAKVADPSLAVTDTSPVSFTRDIYPLLRRVSMLHWVSGVAASPKGHAQNGPNDFVSKVTLLSSKGKNAESERMRIAGALRNPKTGIGKMPKLPEKTNKNVRGPFVPETQYKRMERWAQGTFEADWTGAEPTPVPLDQLPVAEQPKALDRAALEACVGGPFFPGIEVSSMMLDATTYDAKRPFRINAQLHPGTLTARMAVPWQADFHDCGKEGSADWWPGQRPIHVFGAGRKGPGVWMPDHWEREDLVNQWMHLGFIVEDSSSGDTRYVEDERDFKV